MGRKAKFDEKPQKRGPGRKSRKQQAPNFDVLEVKTSGGDELGKRKKR